MPAATRSAGADETTGRSSSSTRRPRPKGPAEVLQIFFEVFGYRGQWRLEVERHRGERADHATVYTSVTPDDFAKLAARAGCHATVTKSGDTPLVALTRGTRAFLAFMDWRVPGQNLYSLVALHWDRHRRPIPRSAG
jgi:hypothetical protein